MSTKKLKFHVEAGFYALVSLSQKYLWYGDLHRVFCVVLLFQYFFLVVVGINIMSHEQS